MGKRLKILVSAYACSPLHGSEPGMGWGFVQALAAYHDLWVMVEEEKFRQEVEKGLEANPGMGQRARFFFIAKKRHPRLRKIWPPSYYWFYRRWQKEAFVLAGKLCKDVRFDVVHQLNMAGFREPGYLWRLGLPFVWGPVGGLVQMPVNFLTFLGPRGFAYHLGRNIVNRIHASCLPRPRLAARRAGPGLIAATGETRRQIEKLWGCHCQLLSEVGPPDRESDGFCHRNPGQEPLRLVWSAAHVARKALPLLLHALARLPLQVGWHLDILGDGPERYRWQALAARLGLGDKCYWHGWVSRSRVLEVMGRGHLMVISSLQDLTSTVTVEALSRGLPIICLDHCGFADVVGNDCGIRIPVTTPGQVVQDMADAILMLASDENYRRQMAEAALKRASDHHWDAKARQLTRIYGEVIKTWRRR